MEDRDSPNGSLATAPADPTSPGAAGATPSISAPASIVGIFVKPRATFEALASKPRVLVPLLLVVVLQLIFGIFIIRSGVALNDTVAKMEAKGESQETIEKVEQAFEHPGMQAVLLAGGPIVVTFILLLQAGLYFFMANLMLGARLTFRDYFCISTYTAVIGVVEQVVVTVLATSKGSLDIRLGAGALLGENPGYFGKVLNSMTDPFILWSTLIGALGVSVFAKKDLKFGVLAVLPAFLILVAMSGTR